MFKKLWIISLIACLLCMGGCKGKAANENSSAFCLRYYDLQALTTAIQESKQKKLANEKMLSEEIFMSNLTEFAFPKVIPEGYELLDIEVWIHSIVYHYLPSESSETTQTDKTRFYKIITYSYDVCSDPTLSYFDGIQNQFNVEPTEDGLLYLKDYNQIVKAVGNDIFWVRGRENVYQEYEELLPLCEEQMIQVE